MAKHYPQVRTINYGDGGPAETIVSIHEDADDRAVETYISVGGEPLRRLNRKPNGPFFAMAKRAYDERNN